MNYSDIMIIFEETIRDMEDLFVTYEQALDLKELWWRHCLTDDQKVDLIVKKHPECLRQSVLMRLSLWRIYNNNPQKLYDDWIKENQKTTKTFTGWLKSNDSK